ncbi:hypothetical protein QR680_001086 [Steinernema hermaphroditum]|uniref:Uncharacterized protein n=1 Tax=Steinernema hermaphroditum TaxID=289476 RepID=A0AA39GYW1_9BILA|nr:hypothetical protein QR680_001086 [Steinernema hermaphroditum]
MISIIHPPTEFVEFVSYRRNGCPPSRSTSTPSSRFGFSAGSLAARARLNKENSRCHRTPLTSSVEGFDCGDTFLRVSEKHLENRTKDQLFPLGRPSERQQ